jgi:dihydrofolate synthase/folylpolyglutamate synthase
VITNIGLDHCDLLGDTLSEIAFEKAGIIKPSVPVVVGESHPETDEVFRRKVLYTNISDPKFMGDRNAVMSLLTFADKVEPSLWDERDSILGGMDLSGSYQRKNLRTVLAALDVLGFTGESVPDAIMHTAGRTGFRGRWETVSETPWVIVDIGHNAHGLRYNFAQLEEMLADGRVSDLIVVYGSVADKDIREVLSLMPEAASYIFTQAHGKRALAADAVAEMFVELRGCASGYLVCPEAAEAIGKAVAMAEAVMAKSPGAKPLIYVGGSTYVVSEVLACLNEKMNIF